MTEKKVLIIDDSMELGRMLRSALESLGMGLGVRVVPSAEEAILEIARSPVQLIITDIRLPGMSGLDLIRKVRDRKMNIRLIAISGITEENLQEKALKAGADAFFRKPLPVGELLDEVQRQLSNGEPVLEKAPAAAVPSRTPAEKSKETNRLADILTQLRQEVGAVSALLVNDLGRIMVQAGELAELDFDAHWAAIVMAAVSANAKVSRLIHAGRPENVQAFTGEKYELVLASVGDFALLVFLRASTSALRLALTFEAAVTAQRALAAVLDEMQVPYYLNPAARPASEPAPVAVEVKTLVEEPHPEMDAARLESLDELLKQPPQPGQASADDFWEAAVGSQNVILSNPDALSYDQALQLGLAPKEGA